MPLIRTDALPWGTDEVAPIRARLTQPFQFELVQREDLRCLFVRSDKNEPDPINDLEVVLNEVPDWAVAEPADIVLLGDQHNFHVPARAAQPLVDRRRRIDQAALSALRAGLDPHYGVGLHRVTGDFANTMRLGLRLPRQSVKQIDDADLNKLAQAVGPSIDAGELRHVRVAYLVAEQDHMRLRGADILADLEPRWLELKATPPPAPATILAPPEPAPAPLPAPAPAVRAPRRKPARTIRVKPIVDLEDHLDSIGVQEKELALLEQAETELDRRLVGAGYEVVRRVEHDGVPLALAAERPNGYPRRVLVRSLRRVERADADHLLRLVRSVEADLLVCLSTTVADSAQRRLLASKVKLLDPRAAASFHL